MARRDEEAGNFLEKVRNIVKEGSLDLSSDEGLILNACFAYSSA